MHHIDEENFIIHTCMYLMLENILNSFLKWYEYMNDTLINKEYVMAIISHVSSSTEILDTHTTSC